MAKKYKYVAEFESYLPHAEWDRLESGPKLENILNKSWDALHAAAKTHTPPVERRSWSSWVQQKIGKK